MLFIAFSGAGHFSGTGQFLLRPVFFMGARPHRLANTTVVFAPPRQKIAKYCETLDSHNFAMYHYRIILRLALTLTNFNAQA